MKLLYLVHQFFPKHYTGTERFTFDLATQMQRMGHYPTVVTYEPNADADQFEKLTDDILIKRYSYRTIPVVALKHAGAVHVSNVFDRAVENAAGKLGLKCDLVHISHPMWLSSIARVCKSEGSPIVLTLTDAWLLCPRALLDRGYRLCNGPDAGERCACDCHLNTMRSRYQDAKTLYYMADEIATGSRFLPTLFRNNEWNRSVSIIPHSINYANVKRIENPRPEKITFGFIGSLAWHKGVHVLIKAIRRVPCQNIRAEIYGSQNEQWDYFKALLDLAQGDERIHFLEPFEIEALPNIIRNISVMVIPSTYYENYPLVTLIAFAYRVPVIASNIGGLPELVKDGYNGYLFEMGNAEALANTIERIAKNPAILDTLSKNIVTPRRTEEEALDYERIYNKLV